METGFFVTREAGPAHEVAAEPHRMYVRESSRPRVLIASGTLLDGRETEIALQVRDGVRRKWQVRRHFTISTTLSGRSTAPGYVPLLLDARGPVLFTDVSISPAHEPVIQPSRGFYSPERDSSFRGFRWVAPRAEAMAHVPGGGARLRLRGRVPLQYYREPLRLSLEGDGRALASVALPEAEFEIDQRLPPPTGGKQSAVLGLTFSAHFVPHGTGIAGRLPSELTNSGSRLMRGRPPHVRHVPFEANGSRSRSPPTRTPARTGTCSPPSCPARTISAGASHVEATRSVPRGGATGAYRRAREYAPAPSPSLASIENWS